MRAVFHTAIIALVCTSATIADTLSSTRWISKTFIGAPLCSTQGGEAAFVPPGFEREKYRLQQLGITVQREFYRDYATCQACKICPSYRREIFFEVLAIDVSKSAEAGYSIATPPESAELLQYDRSKIYYPPPDIPNGD